MQHAVRNTGGIVFFGFCAALLLFAAVSLAGRSASAQGEPGGASAPGIVGLVTDERGAPVPGAEVVASLWVKEFPILLPREAREWVFVALSDGAVVAGRVYLSDCSRASPL